MQFCPPGQIDDLAARGGGVVPLTEDEVAAEVAAMARDPLRWADDGIEPYFSLGGY